MYEEMNVVFTLQAAFGPGPVKFEACARDIRAKPFGPFILDVEVQGVDCSGNAVEFELAVLLPSATSTDSPRAKVEVFRAVLNRLEAVTP